MTHKNVCPTRYEECNFDLKNDGRNVTLHRAILLYHFHIFLWELPGKFCQSFLCMNQATFDKVAPFFGVAGCVFDLRCAPPELYRFKRCTGKIKQAKAFCHK